MDNFNNRGKGETALGVTEGQENKTSEVVNEEAPVFNHGGRKGRSSATRLGADQSDNTDSTQYRVLISPEANIAVDDLIGKVNSGFDGGKVTRPQLVSWVLCKFGQAMSDPDLQEIRAAHFDRIAYFEALLKRAKETGVMPPELSGLLPAASIPTATGKKKRAA